MTSPIDASAFIGDYPFRGFPETTPPELSQLNAQYGIGGAVVSSFHEVFWENNFEAATRTAREIRDCDGLVQFLVVNPTYPRQLQELPETLAATGARGLRLLPNYHGYDLWDERVTELFHFAAEQNLPVQIFREIQDARMHWMLRVPPLSSENLQWLLADPPPARVLLSGLPFSEVMALRGKLQSAARVWFDLSRVRGPVFAVEKLVETLGAEQLVFGSLWPIQMIAPSLRAIEDARITAAQRAQILDGNWQRFARGEA